MKHRNVWGRITLDYVWRLNVDGRDIATATSWEAIQAAARLLLPEYER